MAVDSPHKGPVMQEAFPCHVIIMHLPQGRCQGPVLHQDNLPSSTHSMYCRTSNISRTSVGNKIVDHSHVVGASPVGAAPTTSSFSTQHMASMDWTKTTARRDEKHLSFMIWCTLYYSFDSNNLPAAYDIPLMSCNHRICLSYTPVIWRFSSSYLVFFTELSGVFHRDLFPACHAIVPVYFLQCSDWSVVYHKHITHDLFSTFLCFWMQNQFIGEWCPLSFGETLTYWGGVKIAALFADGIFKCIFLNENFWVSNKIALKYVP